MRSTLLSVVGILYLASAAYPQPTFEVATIKPFDMKSGVSNAGVSVYPGGRLVIHALSLKALIMAAYDAGYWQLVGGEDWMQKEVYDLEAKAPDHTGPYTLRHTRFQISDERLRQMLQALLGERFGLKLERITNTGVVYLLERTAKPLSLSSTKYSEERPAAGAPGFSGEVQFAGGHWFLFNASMSQLAKFASNNILHKPVIDRTALEGSFDYRDPDVKVEQDNSDPEGTFQVFLHDVGLKLTPSKGPVETFLIEHADRPSAN